METEFNLSLVVNVRYFGYAVFATFVTDIDALQRLLAAPRPKLASGNDRYRKLLLLRYSSRWDSWRATLSPKVTRGS
jgi:hypothetical protein